MEMALIKQFNTTFGTFQNKDFTFAIFARSMDADVNNLPENLKSQFNNIALTDFYKYYLVSINAIKNFFVIQLMLISVNLNNYPPVKDNCNYWN